MPNGTIASGANLSVAEAVTRQPVHPVPIHGYLEAAADDSPYLCTRLNDYADCRANLLRGHVEALAHGVGDAQSNLRRAEASGRLLDRLVGNLFAFSTLQYRGAQPAREGVDLADLFRQTAVGFCARAAEKNVAITTDGPEVTTLADEHFLTRVVSNLLDNAVRHVPAGGDVELRWARSNDSIGFTVWNSGDPIPADDLPRLFEPLFRSDSSRNSETGGAGLGLAIARHLIEAHGGTLVAENPAAGGARFAATLPAA